MATTRRRGGPYVYVTWLTKLLAGGDRCAWAAWFKASFKYDKKVDESFDLAAWSTEHNLLVTARARQLRADGWTVAIEDENAFRLQGKGCVLAGKPDIVATRGDDLLVVDVKTGKPRDSDWWQILVYLFALPLVQSVPARLRGEVVYKTHAIAVAHEELSGARRDQIITLLRDLSGPPLEKAPSPRECEFCDISDLDCDARVHTAAAAVMTEAF
jgi:hypothetical protein